MPDKGGDKVKPVVLAICDGFGSAPAGLQGNAVLMAAILAAKPSAAKGQYLRKISLSASMGPSFKIDPGDAAAVAAQGR